MCVSVCDSVGLMDPCLNSVRAECQSLMVAMMELINSLDVTEELNHWHGVSVAPCVHVDSEWQYECICVSCVFQMES